MHTVVLPDGADFAAWRSSARDLLAADVAPDQVQWQVGEEGGLFGSAPAEVDTGARISRSGTVPREFLAMADLVLAHNDPRRHSVLYRILWRLNHGERNLLKIAADDDVAWTSLAGRAVRRDMHKMKAFVRFREVVTA